LRRTFFRKSLESSEDIEAFKKNLDDEILFLIELTSQDYFSIQYMPYSFFKKAIEWKWDLEEKKRKKLKDRMDGKE